MKRTSMRYTEMAFLVLLAVAPAAGANEAKFTVFDPVGSQGTFASANNLFGEIAGYYFDGSTYHGFLRSPHGKLTTFDPPGSFATIVLGINLEGATTGFYADGYGLVHGFIRSPSGVFVSFDAPSADGDTEPASINQFGEAAGTYSDAAGVQHGFLRGPKGTITEFDAPGADLGTLVGPVNAEGAIAGDYHVSNSSVAAGFVSHGVVRSPEGTFTSFDVPGAGDTFTFGLNDEGETTGIWVVDHGDVEHGYVRTRDGKFTSFDVPGAGTGTAPNQQGTEPISINALGEVTGDFLDANSVYHGFLRTCDGRTTKFDAPGAGTAPQAGQGTLPQSNNLSGEIVGYFVDVNGTPHGFLRKE